MVSAEPTFASAEARKGDVRLLALIAGLYVTQGLPLGFAFEALPVLARRAGASLDLLAFLPLSSLPWIAKFLWAPLVDNRGSRRFGRRKSWLVPCQILLGLGLLAIGFVPIRIEQAPLLAALVLVATLAAATQDTATDGLAAERLTGRALAHANAIQIGGWIAGFMLGGSGFLVAANAIGARGALVLLALLPLASAAGLLLWREGRAAREAAHPKASLRRTLSRPGFAFLLTLSFVYGMAQVGVSSVTRLFLTDNDWSPDAIGWVGLLGHVATAAIGCPAGAYLANRFGLWRALMAGLLCGASALLLWSLPAAGLVPATLAVVLSATLLVGLAAGLVGVAASILAMRFGGAGDQPSTDVTVLQSANVLGEMMIASFVVWLAARTGYASALWLVAAALLPVALLVLRERRRIGFVGDRQGGAS